MLPSLRRDQWGRPRGSPSDQPVRPAPRGRLPAARPHLRGRRRAPLAQAGLTVHRAALATPPPAWAKVRAALVRPDGHIAWAAESTDDATLTAAANMALAITNRT
ncbi:hypothetical protein [Streptomyces sp. NBC_00378]|uniref:aromatic-ring hydroxylase C-terminal domain-containing protein n=1 Tax=unclassified Streptomyces TaxID=2593676 RepID=UPI00338F5D4E